MPDFLKEQRVLVRNDLDSKWEDCFFSHKTISGNGKDLYVCTGATRAWKFCIPYDGNEHILGTTSEPDTIEQQDFKWGDHVEVRKKGEEKWQKAVFVSAFVVNGCVAYKAFSADEIVEVFAFCRHAEW